MPNMVRISFLSFLAIAASATAFAAPRPSAPSLKPALVAASDVVSTRDANLFREGLNAVDSGDWRTVRRIESDLRDGTAKDVMTWYRARRDVTMPFSQIDWTLTKLADWPEASAIRGLAEERIELSGLNAADRIAWFESHDGATTGAGHLVYAQALQAAGRSNEAFEQVRKAWHGRTLTNDQSTRTLQRYGSKFTQDDHRKRADFLLWTRQTTAAQRLAPRLTPDWRALVDARIKLIRRQRGVDAALDAVPASLQDHPGLLYDRAYWRRRSRMTDQVAPLLRQIDGDDVPPAGRTRLWRERNIAVRSALKAGDFDLAYDLSAPHGMSEGREFAEAEWMAGWIALRHHDNPARALTHFETLLEGVGTPISLSRAHYWIGRAKDAFQDEAGANTAYLAAANYPFTYYGQLASELAAQRVIDLPNPVAVTADAKAAFADRSLVRAMRLFAENGWDAAFRKFAYHLDDQLSTPAEFEMLAALGREYHYADIGVRGAKAGLAKGVVAADAAYPLVEYPLIKEPQVERSLMLALSRQESEMNPSAISHANARGLMQFIPRTAQLEARNQGLPFRQSWLTDDPGYNMTLGGAHLDTLLGQFNGSYIMAAAAYNAGASRPRQWIGDYGDPRAGEVDPIDWVEFIPFSETRNYVQRVLENTQVYRYRLQGEPVDIQLSEDLERGRFGNADRDR